MINYKILQGESLPYIRIVVDEQLTIIDQYWRCEAVITNKSGEELIRKPFKVEGNSFKDQFSVEELLELEPNTVYDINIITYNLKDGFKDITKRRFYLEENTALMASLNGRDKSHSLKQNLEDEALRLMEEYNRSDDNDNINLGNNSGGSNKDDTTNDGKGGLDTDKLSATHWKKQFDSRWLIDRDETKEPLTSYLNGRLFNGKRFE